MANLTEAFERIAAENDLRYISLSMSTAQSPSSRWLCSVQWDGYGREDINCAQIHAATPEEALRLSLDDARRQRTPLEPESDPLEIAA